MPAYLVTCAKRHPQTREITHLGIPNATPTCWLVADVMNSIKSRTHTFHTEVRVNNEPLRAEIEVFSQDGSPEYLKTSRDTTTKNNLHDLPECDRPAMAIWAERA